MREFRQVDVFTEQPCLGNPVAVVHGADGLSDDDMQLFARWTNLSETTFLLIPRDDQADYRVRIFTPAKELPFAGHPTLGTCHAWLEAGGRPAEPGVIVQECDAGLIPVRLTGDRLAFAAPPLVRGGPVEESLITEIAAILGIKRDDIADAQWADNGPGWVAVLLHSAEAVLALAQPDCDFDLGVVGPYPKGSPEAFEVRAFFPKDGKTAEDPVTGSLNASLAQWLLGSGKATAPYIASQGTALGRRGRVHVTADDAAIWIGGGTLTLIAGTVRLLTGRFQVRVLAREPSYAASDQRKCLNARSSRGVGGACVVWGSCPAAGSFVVLCAMAAGERCPAAGGGAGRWQVLDLRGTESWEFLPDGIARFRALARSSGTMQRTSASCPRAS